MNVTFTFPCVAIQSVAGSTVDISNTDEGTDRVITPLVKRTVMFI